MLTLPKIVVLAAIQGLTELLPVSSSAHVIVAEKLMGLDPTLPQMTLLLVMLHTGTMLAVIVFFWDSWKTNFFKTRPMLVESLKFMAAATAVTLGVGLFLKILIEKVILQGISHAEMEFLFGNLNLIAEALACAGVLILWAGWHERSTMSKPKSPLGMKAACIIGFVQGICVPFRGFSRSGATISTGLILGLEKRKAEDFSFALVVILTPLAIAVEVLRLFKEQHQAALESAGLTSILAPSLVGMVFSFIAGLFALRWLSRWLEKGRWHWFGLYCLFASAAIFFLHSQGL